MESTTDFSTLVTSPYGSRWRSLRKTSPARLRSISKVWSNAVENLIRKFVQRKSKSKVVVVLRSMVREMFFEILMTILAGERGELEAVMETIKDVLEHTGTANPADFVALLKWIDFTGYRKSSKVDGLLQGILDERRRRRCENGGSEDVLIDNLLELR